VNFNDIAEIDGFAHLLMALFQKNRAFDCAISVSTTEITALRKAGREWISRVNQKLNILPIGDSIRLLPNYNFIHIPVCHRQADRKLINNLYHKAFDCYVRGDQTIGEVTLFRAIRDALVHREKEFLDKPLQWYSSILGKWFGQSKSGLLYDYPQVQAIGIASCIISSDLFAFTNRQETVKRGIADKLSPIFEKLNDLDSDTLYALFPYINAIRPEIMSFEESSAHLAKIRHILSSRPDINIFSRTAFAVDIENSKSEN